MKIVHANTEEEYKAARELIVAYQQWLNVDLCFQGFSQELENLATMYGPPEGAMLLAQCETTWTGCVGLRHLAEGIAEMKRMFVLPKYQSQGIGRELTQELIRTARSLGYRSIRLDTVPRLDRAICLYERAGFPRIPPYRHNPDPEAVFMELKLQ